MVTTKSATSVELLYKQDFYLWLTENIRALKEGKLLEIDYQNLIEELEEINEEEMHAWQNGGRGAAGGARL